MPNKLEPEKDEPSTLVRWYTNVVMAIVVIFGVAVIWSVICGVMWK